jgi:ankyrin repeat protein
MNMSNIKRYEILQKTKGNEKRFELNKQLYTAVLAGRNEVIEHLIKDGADLYSQEGKELRQYDNEENTLLHIAARNGDLDIVKLLISLGTQIDVKNRRLQTPLLWAIHNGHLAVVNFLIEKGADILTQENEGDTPLSWAAYTGQLRIIERLLECPNININIEKKEGAYNTPLHWASYNGHTEIVRLLIAKGADFKKKNDMGDTPLDCAIHNGHTETAEFLMQLDH